MGAAAKFAGLEAMAVRVVEGKVQFGQKLIGVDVRTVLDG
jgi:hypothetical protein